jgi:hypothetical protein
VLLAMSSAGLAYFSRKTRFSYMKTAERSEKMLDCFSFLDAKEIKDNVRGG